MTSRQHVLDCAARLFRNEGYAAVSLRDIASESGMKAGSLYYHFESKDEIVIEILNIGVRRVHEAVAGVVGELPGNAPVAQVIGAAIHAHLRALLDSGDYTSANIRIYGQVPQRVRGGHRTIRRAYEALWAELLGRFQASGEIRAEINLVRLRAFVLGAMNSSLEWAEPKRGIVARIAGDLTALVLHGAVV